MGRALGSDRPAAALYDLARASGAPVSLRELGMAETDLDRAAELAVANPYWNPRPVDQRTIRELLQRAWDGTRPDQGFANACATRPARLT
jgi:maleylacetate reductase